MLLNSEDVISASKRIKNHINHTPIISCDFLNEKLNNQIYFKIEAAQKTGSFKARGAFNHLLYLKEKGQLPKKIVVVSSGNHAQAVAYAAKILGINALIYMSKTASSLKIAATRNYGAQVIIAENRKIANELTAQKAKEDHYFIDAFSDNLVIAGQGTACLETLEEISEIDSVFVPCGGGGLTIGTYLAAQKLKNPPQVFGVEPQIANDVVRSLKTGKIYAFEDTPPSIADGMVTLSTSLHNLEYLKKISGVLEVSEEDIIYWTQWLHHLLKITIEPTSAAAMAGCFAHIKANKISGQKILIIISGGNISAETNQKIWQRNYLDYGKLF